MYLTVWWLAWIIGGGSGGQTEDKVTSLMWSNSVESDWGYVAWYAASQTPSFFCLCEFIITDLSPAVFSSICVCPHVPIPVSPVCLSICLSLCQSVSFSSVTDSTMSLNIITVTLNMGEYRAALNTSDGLCSYLWQMVMWLQILPFNVKHRQMNQVLDEAFPHHYLFMYVFQ